MKRLFLLILLLVISVSSEAGVTYIHTDALGSVVGKSDENGNIVKRHQYEPFGKKVTVSENNKPGYSGHVYDDDLSLSYMKARYYDPVVGRFYSNDPIGFRDVHSFNRYAYANNNPFKFVDPDGANAVTFVGGLLTESFNFVSGNGFDTSFLGGALSDWYDGEGQGFGSALFEDVTTFVPLGAIAGTGIKGLRLLRAGKAARAVTKGGSTLKPGRFAKDSIPARGPGRNFTKAERDKINQAGKENGCHTCGTKTAGTKSDNFIPDHQPPNALNPSGGSQRLLPHCKTCSGRQGGQVTQQKRRLNQ